MLQTMIIFALLSIIPAGIVFLVMHTKNQEILRRMNELRHDADMLDQLEKAQRELYGSGESIKLDLASVKESFQRLSNKIAARSRPDRNREPEERPQPEEPQHEQQTIDFPFQVPPQQPQPAATRIIMQPKKWRAA